MTSDLAKILRDLRKRLLQSGGCIEQLNETWDPIQQERNVLSLRLKRDKIAEVQIGSSQSVFFK